MKMQELNTTELQEVNGGNNYSSSQGSFFGSFDLSSMFSYQSSSSNNNSNNNSNRNSSSSFSLGSGASAGFGGMFGQNSYCG